MFYNTWLINQCLHCGVVSPLMTTDHGPLHCRHLSRSLGSHNPITARHKHYKDSSRITIIIQTHLEIANLSLNQFSMIPWKLIVNFPSDQALSHLATIPPSSQSWLRTHSAAGADLHHRSRSIARIPRIARLQYGDRNLPGLWHHQTSTHRNIQDIL